MRSWFMRVLLFLAAVLATNAFAVNEVRVDGLFKGRAVLTIDGNMRVLKVGETSPEGVRLISSDSRQAKLEINGKRQSLSISEHIASSFVAAEKAEVRIPPGPGGHYYVGGFINGHAVDFMLDTGATMIAMSGEHARRLNIDLRQATPSMTSTANGNVESFVVNVDRVQVGGITVHQVPVSVLSGNFPSQILLGNSFLSRVEMNESNGVLVLKQKY